MRAGSYGTAATLSRDASGDGIPTNLSSMIANLIGIPAFVVQSVERFLGKDSARPTLSSKVESAFVAQPVERFLGKEEAGGSNPPEGLVFFPISKY